MIGELRLSRCLATALLLCAAALFGEAFAASPLEAWRTEAARVRMLAENDAPRARQLAQRLLASLPPGATAADQATALNLIARAETYMALTDDAATHAQRALDLAKAHGDRVGQVEADLNIALNSVNQGRIDLLVAATTHSLTALQGLDRPDLVVEAMLRTAMMYRRVGKFDESVTLSMQTLEIARRSRLPLALAYAHQGMGISFGQSGRENEAREHFLRMRDEARAAKSKLLEAYALTSLGFSAALRGEFRSGEASHREAIALYRAVGAPFGLSHGLYGLAEIFRVQQRHAEAVVLLGDAIDIYTRYPNHIGLWFALNARSLYHEALGERAAALADAQRAHELAEVVGLPLYRSDSARRLAALAAAAGNHKRAYELSVEADQLTAKANQDKASARTLELAQRYETDSRKREVDELTRRNQLQAAELGQRVLRQRWLYTMLAAAGIALAGTAFFVLRLRRSRAAVRALNATLEQRVQAATAGLRQQTIYLRTLLDMLPMLAWLKDTGSRYLTVNQATAAACGATVEQMVGKPDKDFWPSADADSYRADDLEVMSSRQRSTIEQMIENPKGPVWIETYRAPVLDEDGTVLGTVGVARDISKRKAGEAAREAALAEAHRLAEQRTAFMAQMSHELRTPLNGILGFAQILQHDKQALNDLQTRGLKIIEESGRHLLALINDVLDLARIDAAKVELYPTDIKLPAFLAVVADIVRVKAEEKHLLFVQQLADDLPPVVRADEQRLRQVLLNLLSNAIKFTDNGQVSLRVTAVAQTASAATLRFEVRDSGIGMDAAQLARLFQPFEQVGEARRRAGGSGLGLAISRQLARLMGGDIQVGSEPGQGSSFSFELALPVAEPTGPAEIASLGLPLGYEGAKKTVLIADDVPQNRAVLCDGLRQLGFEIAEAGDGQEALRLARERPLDLVITDIVMPVMDGLALARRIRADPRLAHLPIIAASGSPHAKVEAECQSAGANAFIAKPIDREELLSLVGRLLGLNWTYAQGAPQGRPGSQPGGGRETELGYPLADSRAFSS